MTVSRDAQVADGVTLQQAVERRIDVSRIGQVQWTALILMCLFSTMDGFDLASLAIAVPLIVEEWNVDAALFGMALAAALAGLGIGNMIFGALGDRWGRRPLLLASGLIMCAGALGTAWASSIVDLTFWRFVTGLGFGACMPNGSALICDFMPLRKRVLAMALFSGGISVGAMIAGIVAPALAGLGGWRLIFIVGGALPLALAALAFAMVEESPKFLAGPYGDESRLQRLLDRMYGNLPMPAGTRQAADVGRVSLVAVLRRPYILTTLLYAIVWTANAFTFYLLTSWLPVLLNRVGQDVATAMHGVSIVYGGALGGGLAIAWVMDRAGPRWPLVPMLMFLTGAGLLASFALIPAQPMLWSIILLGIGFTIGGSQFILPGVGGMVYPAMILATGLGLVGAVSRIGGVLGPLAGGWAVGAGWNVVDLFMLMSVPALMCAVALGIFYVVGLDRASE